VECELQELKFTIWDGRKQDLFEEAPPLWIDETMAKEAQVLIVLSPHGRVFGLYTENVTSSSSSSSFFFFVEFYFHIILLYKKGRVPFQIRTEASLLPSLFDPIDSTPICASNDLLFLLYFFGAVSFSKEGIHNMHQELETRRRRIRAVGILGIVFFEDMKKLSEDRWGMLFNVLIVNVQNESSFTEPCECPWGGRMGVEKEETESHIEKELSF